ASIERDVFRQMLRTRRHEAAVVPGDLHRGLVAASGEVVDDLGGQRVARRLLPAVESPGGRSGFERRGVLQAEGPVRMVEQVRRHVTNRSRPPIQPAAPVERVIDRMVRYEGCGTKE